MLTTAKTERVTAEPGIRERGIHAGNSLCKTAAKTIPEPQRRNYQ